MRTARHQNLGMDTDGMIELQGVILDVDGTLVDSERDGHRVAFNLAFEELGLPYRWDVELYGRLLEITGGQSRLHAYLEDQGVAEGEREELVPRLHARKTELFQQLIEEGGVTPRPGVPELLDDLASDGVRLGIATTGTRAWVEPLLARLFGLERFEVVVTGDEAPVRKPDPSAYTLALDQMSLRPRGIVALEDSRNGLLAASAADLPCLVVVNDYTRSQDFEGAALVLDGFGSESEPARVLLDPLGLARTSVLRADTLRELVRAAPR